MILSQDKTSATISGNIQNNKVGIDVNNINFITTILTSNLYSLPIESFLRETVANAWDSQVEAGNTNTPILIKISKLNDNDDITISIRDYGTGLSPERFDEIYRNIGSSTKRESNEFIGALGLGRFTALAVSDLANIKSYYQGKCYSYLMYKDGETLNIDLLNTTDTDSENGVDVQVTIKDAWESKKHIIDGLAALSYFEQIYVDTNVGWLGEFVDRFNRRTIHEFENFKVCSIEELKGLHFLMGNVLYKCTDTSFIEFQNNPSIAVTCNIGDIDVTPNRESVRYSDKTKTFLTNRVAEVNKEIYKLAKDIRNGDFETIREYQKVVDAEPFRMTLWKFPDKFIDVKITKTQLDEHHISSNCTVRGKKAPRELSICYNHIIAIRLPYTLFSYRYRSEQFCKPERIGIGDLLIAIKENRAYYINEPYKPLTKKYFRENHPYYSYRFVYFIRKEQLKHVFYECALEFLRYYSTKRFGKNSIRLVLEEIEEAFKNIPSFNNSDVPKEYIQANKEEKEVTRRNCIIYKLVNGRGYYKDTRDTNIVTNSDEDLLKILRTPRTIIYAERNSEEALNLRFMYRLFRYANLNHKYLFIETAKSNIPTLQSIKKLISITTFMSVYNRDLAKVFTGKYLKNTDYLWISNCYDYSKIISKIRTYRDRARHVDFDDHNITDYNELYNYYVSRDWLDKDIIEKAQNPAMKQISDFLKKIKCYSSLDLGNEIALNYFIYKYNIKLGNINRISAYKFLKTI